MKVSVFGKGGVYVLWGIEPSVQVIDKKVATLDRGTESIMVMWCRGHLIWVLENNVSVFWSVRKI